MLNVKMAKRSLCGVRAHISFKNLDKSWNFNMEYFAKSSPQTSQTREKYTQSMTQSLTFTVYEANIVENALKMVFSLLESPGKVLECVEKCVYQGLLSNCT